MDEESNPFLTPPVAHQLERVDDNVFSFRKKKPIAKRIIPHSPIRPPRKSPARPKRTTELVERPTAADSVPSQYQSQSQSSSSLDVSSRSSKLTTGDRKKGQQQQQLPQQSWLQQPHLQQPLQTSQPIPRPKRSKVPAVGTENCDLIWKGKFLTYTFPLIENTPAAPSSALKKKIKAKLTNRRAGDSKEDEEDAVKPIMTRIPGVVFALPQKVSDNKISGANSTATAQSDALSSENSLLGSTSSKRNQFIAEGTSMHVVSKIQMSTFPPFLLRPDIEPCRVCPITKQSRTYFRRLLDEETVLDALARSMSSGDGSALADVGILVRAVAEKTKKSKKKLTLMEAILSQSATLRNGNGNSNDDKETTSIDTAVTENTRKRMIYEKTLIFLISASVTMNEAGLPSVSFHAHPLLDYSAFTKTILHGSQSLVHTKTENNPGSGRNSTHPEKKPIIDINDLAEHVTKEKPTDLDQGLGLLPQSSSSTSPTPDITTVKKEEDESRDETAKIEDPIIHTLMYGSEGESEDEDMEDMEQLIFNLRASIARDEQRITFEEPSNEAGGQPATPRKKSTKSTTTITPLAKSSPVTMDLGPVGNSKKRAASTMISSMTANLEPSSPFLDEASSRSKKRKDSVATATESLSSLSSIPSSSTASSSLATSQHIPEPVVTAPVPVVTVQPPTSAMATVLTTPKVTPLPAEVSAAPTAAVPKTGTTTEHRNKETVKALMNTVLAKINIGSSHDDYEEYSDEILNRVLFSMRKDLTSKLYHLEELERLMDRHAEML
ncbi:hypothetical protein BGZ83_004722 [Gryganskiella cystojenkinii]|nr:hypothetical protein BGZ83_004722 [Gryganskiella cystojenkinii]